MRDDHVTFNYIGIIQTPFTKTKNMPTQPSRAEGMQGKLLIYPKYQKGLLDLEGFSHIFVIYHLHKIGGFHLTVTSWLDTSPHGVFATRTPKRPNPIGLSLVHLVSIEENVLTLENVDMLDGTPVLDIKPYVPVIDQGQNIRVGWLEEKGKLS